MDQSHGFDAILTVHEHCHISLVVNVTGLKIEKAGNHLQVIFDTVMDLLQQYLFLP